MNADHDENQEAPPKFVLSSRSHRDDQLPAASHWWCTSMAPI